MNAHTHPRPSALNTRRASAGWNPVKAIHSRFAGMTSYRRSADAGRAGNGPHALGIPASPALDTGLRRHDERGRDDGLAA